jgi:ABC-2 type transport system ATP-binding protein/lipopolysaccharide transport system ATP-binding protein
MVSIALSNVSLQFPLYQGSSRSLKRTLLGVANVGREKNRVVVRALEDVSLSIGRGERIGLIGHNGAGKTTLLRVLAGVYEPSQGRVEIDGQVRALLDFSLGLDVDATGYENIFMRGLYLGLHPSEIRRLVPEIAEFTELGQFLHMLVRTYSSGMGLRLAFAVATATQPEILLMDEWMLAGDAQFMHKARERIGVFVNQSQILVLASHSIEIIKEWCTRVIWLESGRIVMTGDPDHVIDCYERRVAGDETVLAEMAVS